MTVMFMRSVVCLPRRVRVTVVAAAVVVADAVAVAVGISHVIMRRKRQHFVM